MMTTQLTNIFVSLQKGNTLHNTDLSRLEGIDLTWTIMWVYLTWLEKHSNDLTWLATRVLLTWLDLTCDSSKDDLSQHWLLQRLPCFPALISLSSKSLLSLSAKIARPSGFQNEPERYKMAHVITWCQVFLTWHSMMGVCWDSHGGRPPENGEGTLKCTCGDKTSSNWFNHGLTRTLQRYDNLISNVFCS